MLKLQTDLPHEYKSIGHFVSDISSVLELNFCSLKSTGFMNFVHRPSYSEFLTMDTVHKPGDSECCTPT
jgi:hypothetical protein